MVRARNSSHRFVGTHGALRDVSAAEVTEVSGQQDVEGEPEGDDEDGEDDQHLHQRLQDLQEHHHVNTKHVKSAERKIDFGPGPIILI